MSTSRPFAYNSGLSPISGTIQVINSPIAIGVNDQDYTLQPGGIQWWEGPDEDLGYVIAHSVPTGTQPNPLGIPAYIGFWRSNLLLEPSFVEKAGFISNKIYNLGDEAYIWMNGFGYWSSWTVTPGSLSFPAGGSVTTITPNEIGTLSDTFTIEFWYYGDHSITGTEQVIFSQNGSIGDIEFFINHTNGCMYGFGGIQLSTKPLDTNSWQHIAIVCSAGVITYYMNGIDRTIGGLPTFSINNVTDTIYLGSRGGTNKFFQGYLTNIRLTKSSIYLGAGFNLPTSPLLPIQGSNPYGGSNTTGISDGECVLLINSLNPTSQFAQDLSSTSTLVTNDLNLTFDSGSPY